MRVDLLVYDSTSAGIFAAVSAARAGATTAILTEDRHIGGLQTSGLGNTNAGQRQIIGGMVREFHDRIMDYYSREYGAESEQFLACDDGFFFEPHVAEHVFEQLIDEAGVTVLRQEYPQTVRKGGTDRRRIEAVRTDCDREIEAEFFLDASYEGDLFALAGCDYHVGREPASRYGESLGGIRYPESERGNGDRAIQAHDYRLCLTDNSENLVPHRKPRDYDRQRYAWLAAQYEALDPDKARLPLPLNPMPNRKTDSRTGEWVGAGWHYPEASRQERRVFEAEQRSYTAGYLWFAQQDRSVPEWIREKLSTYGFAADEFTDNDNWPWHMYVREARRLIGEYVMTQADVTDVNRLKEDSVALGDFFLDVHPVRMVHDPRAVGSYIPEGELPRWGLRPYALSYRAFLPKRDQAVNLFVPVALSASHVGFSPIRMEPTWGMLGHAAGVAAVMSMEQQRFPYELSVDQLQSRLLEQKQIIDASQFNDYWPDKKG